MTRTRTVDVDVASPVVYGPDMTPRDVLSVRVSSAGIAQLDQLAEDVGSDRSNVARALLAEALSSTATITAAKARLRTAL